MASELGVQTIQHTNGTDAMTIDSSGRILTPARPSFFVSHDPSSTVGLNGTLNFNTVHSNTGSHFDITNDRFVAPVAGFYHFSFTGLGSGTTGGGLLVAGNAGRVEIQRSTDSGANYTPFAHAYAYFPSSNSYPNMACSGAIELTVGDYVIVNVTHNYIYADTGGRYDPRFSGFLVG